VHCPQIKSNSNFKAQQIFTLQHTLVLLNCVPISFRDVISNQTDWTFWSWTTNHWYRNLFNILLKETQNKSKGDDSSSSTWDVNLFPLFQSNKKFILWFCSWNNLLLAPWNSSDFLLEESFDCIFLSDADDWMEFILLERERERRVFYKDLLECRWLHECE
jgi:hypothetical protein